MRHGEVNAFKGILTLIGSLEEDGHLPAAARQSAYVVKFACFCAIIDVSPSLARLSTVVSQFLTVLQVCRIVAVINGEIVLWSTVVCRGLRSHGTLQLQHATFGCNQRYVASAGSIRTVLIAVIIDLGKRNVLWHFLRNLLGVILRHHNHHVILCIERQFLIIYKHGVSRIEVATAVGLCIPALEHEVAMFRNHVGCIDQTTLQDFVAHIGIGHDIHQLQIQCRGSRVVGISTYTLLIEEINTF